MLTSEAQARQDRLLDFQRVNRAVGRWTTRQFRAGADGLSAETAERALRRDALKATVARAGRAAELTRLFRLGEVGAYGAAESAVGLRPLPCPDDEIYASGADLARWRHLEQHLQDHALALVTSDLVAPGDAAPFRSPLAA